MKTVKLFSAILLSLFILTSLQNTPTLSGDWVMIGYRDLETNFETWRPESCYPGQLRFTFQDNGLIGSVNGNTTSNKVSGDYQIENNKIQVLRFGGTKVAENGWGSNFCAIGKSESFQFRQDTLVIKYDADSKEMLFLPSNTLN